ncbi:MAG: hypothetical protein ACOZIN_15615, partial [Myxococcota bacterium]
MSRPVGSPDPHDLLRIWRRVLAQRLRRRMQASVVVEIHDNTHTMVTYQRSRAGWRLRLHHMFLAAPEPVLGSLVRYVRFGDSESSAMLDRFIERNRVYIRRLPPEQLQRRLRIAPKGAHHDLGRIFERLNRRFFQNRVRATITYGPSPPPSRRPRKSIKMGSYSADARVIRIHPALDQPRVPRFFVEWIVFHEMLHQVHRARRRDDGRRCVHTPEFVAHERCFPAFDRARRWEEENLDLLLNPSPRG